MQQFKISICRTPLKWFFEMSLLIQKPKFCYLFEANSYQ